MEQPCPCIQTSPICTHTHSYESSHAVLWFPTALHFDKQESHFRGGLYSATRWRTHKNLNELERLSSWNLDACCVDSGSSGLAIDLDTEMEAFDDLKVWRQAQKLYEAAIRKAHPRPLIISRLDTAHDTSGYHGCLCGESSLLSAFTVQVSKLNQIATFARLEVLNTLERNLAGSLEVQLTNFTNSQSDGIYSLFTGSLFTINYA